MASKRIELDIRSKSSGDGLKKTAKDLDDLDRKHKKVTNSSIGLSKSQQTLSGRLKTSGAAMSVFGGNLGKSASKMGAAGGAVSTLTGLLGTPLLGAVAAAGAAIGAFALLSYQKAVASQAEWAKFKGVVESAGQSFDNSKQVVKDFAFTAGRSVGDVRGAFQKLTAAGLNPSQEALRATSELAIGLGTDMTAAATAYNRIVAGKGGRSLSQMGITMEEISTGGKVDTAKLNQILEKKFGKAADNFGNTSDAAGTRLQTSIDGLMVAFGNLLLGPAAMIQNALAWLIKGLTDFGGWLFNAFGGGNAFSGAMEFLTPVIAELGKAFSDLMAEIFPNTAATGQLKPILTALGATLAAFIRPIVMAIQAVLLIVRAGKTAAAWIQNAGSQIMNGARSLWDRLVSAGQYIYSIPGRVSSAIMNGVSGFANSIRNAGSSLLSAIRGAPGWIYNAIVNAIPRINWPSWGDIAGWIKNMIWGSRGPGMGLGNVGNMIASQSALRQQNLAAQRAAVMSAYNASPAAQTAATQATANMGVLGRLGGLFRGPGDFENRLNGMQFNYQNYAGGRQKAWDGGDCMTGNCVDMSMGVLNLAAASGAKSGSLAFGTWNGGPHVWAVVDGKPIDPARKALNGTFAPPARGPGGSGNTYVFNGPVYDWTQFKKQVAKANDSIVSRTY